MGQEKRLIELTPQQSLLAFRKQVGETLFQRDQAIHQEAGVVMRYDAGIHSLLRDASAQTKSINWSEEYQLRTLTYLQTALTLLEIFSTSHELITQPILVKLNEVFQDIQNPELWRNTKDAQANFGKFNDDIFNAIHDKLAMVGEKDFNYANGWLSLELEPYTIETQFKYNNKKYTIKSEPYCALTDDIKTEFLERKQRQWYISLSENTKRICDHYLVKIIAGESHQLPPALRGLIPGLKNAYHTSLWKENEELVDFYHCATAPMGNEDMDKDENIRLTRLNYAAMRDDDDKVIYTTLVSRLGDIPRKIVRDLANAQRNMRGQPLQKEELIDGTIATIAAEASQEDDNIYHTNVCLNTARLFESFSLSDFEKILQEIEAYLDEKSIPELQKIFNIAQREFENLKDWDKKKIISAVSRKDKEVFSYNFLSVFALLIYQYNQSVDQGKKIRWFFGCASGQNRTQILALMVVLNTIHKNISLPSNNSKQEIASVLAKSGHFNFTNGQHDFKRGVREKSSGSVPKEIRPFVEDLFTGLADTKRSGDKQYQEVTAQDLLQALENVDANNQSKIKEIWDDFIGRYPNEAAWINLLNLLLESPKRCDKFNTIIQFIFNDENILRLLLLLETEKYTKIICDFYVILRYLSEKPSEKIKEEFECFLNEKAVQLNKELIIILAAFFNKYKNSQLWGVIGVKHAEYVKQHAIEKIVTLQCNLTFDQFCQVIFNKANHFQKIDDDHPDLRLGGWECSYRRGVHTYQAIPQQCAMGDALDVSHNQELVFTVEPMSRAGNKPDAVEVTVRRHKPEDMILAVQTMIESLPSGGDREICITVDERNADSKKIMVAYSMVILGHKAIPILVENGRRLNREESKAKLQNMATTLTSDENKAELQCIVDSLTREQNQRRPQSITETLSLTRRDNHSYDLMGFYNATEEKIKDECEQDRESLISLKSRLAKGKKDAQACIHDLIAMTYLRKNLSQQELVNIILQSREELSEEDRPLMALKLQKQLTNYAIKHAHNFKPQDLVSKLMQWLEGENPVHNNRQALPVEQDEPDRTSNDRDLQPIPVSEEPPAPSAHEISTTIIPYTTVEENVIKKLFRNFLEKNAQLVEENDSGDSLLARFHEFFEKDCSLHNDFGLSAKESLIFISVFFRSIGYQLLEFLESITESVGEPYLATVMYSALTASKDALRQQPYKIYLGLITEYMEHVTVANYGQEDKNKKLAVAREARDALTNEAMESSSRLNDVNSTLTAEESHEMTDKKIAAFKRIIQTNSALLEKNMYGNGITITSRLLTAMPKAVVAAYNGKTPLLNAGIFSGHSHGRCLVKTVASGIVAAPSLVAH